MPTMKSHGECSCIEYLVMWHLEVEAPYQTNLKHILFSGETSDILWGQIKQQKPLQIKRNTKLYMPISCC